MSADPITQGIRRGAAVFGFLKAWRRNFAHNRRARRIRKGKCICDAELADDECPVHGTKEFVPPTEDLPMNVNLLIALAGSLLRHFLPWATALLAGMGIQTSPDASPWLTIGLAVGVYLAMQAVSFYRQWQKNRAG